MAKRKEPRAPVYKALSDTEVLERLLKVRDDCLAQVEKAAVTNRWKGALVAQRVFRECLGDIAELRKTTGSADDGEPREVRYRWPENAETLKRLAAGYDEQE